MKARSFFFVGSVVLLLIACQWAIAVGAAPVKITFSTWSSSPIIDSIKQAAQEFQKANPGIEIEFEMVPCCNQATIEKYVVQIAAGTGPDIMQIPYACFAEMAAGGMLLPLNNYIDADKTEVDVNDIFPPAWDAVTYRGQYYGMPYDLSAQWMAFIPQNFADAGLELPIATYKKGAWNWNTLREAAKKITKLDAENKIDRIGMIIQFNELMGQPWLYQTGSTPFTGDLKQARLTDNRIVEALRFLADMRHQDRTLLSAWSEPVADPHQGRFGVWPQWLSIPYYFKGSTFQADIVPAPEGPVGHVTTGQVHGISIWSGTKHPQEAWQFVKYITGKVGYQPLIDVGLAPIRRSLVPYYVKTLNSELKTEGVDLFLQDVGRLRLFQVTPEWVRVDEAIVNGLAPVWNGTEALETALVKINDLVNAILKQ